MFFKRKCHNCEMPAARRAQQCLHCEERLLEGVEPSVSRTKTIAEWVAISCVACSCLAFVLSCGLTGMYRDGGLLWGGISLALVLASISWVRKLERKYS